MAATNQIVSNGCNKLANLNNTLQRRKSIGKENEINDEDKRENERLERNKC